MSVFLPPKAHINAVFASSLFLSFAYLPQALAAVPSSVAPEHLEQRFQEPPSAPDVQASVVAPAPVQQTLQNPDEQFGVYRVEVEGVTVYPNNGFADIFAPKIGKNTTFAGALEMAREITNRYRRDGYILSQAIVSNPDLMEAKRSGILHIKVVEGFIHNVIINNEHPEADSRGLIKSYADKISADRPLNTAELERYMLLINDLPGVKARAIIRPSPDTFGAADLVIEVKNKPFEASFTSDNRGNKYLGPYQEQATVTENSVAGLGERTTLRVINSIPFTDLHYMDIQHEEQIGTEGTRVIALISLAKTQPGGALDPLDFSGTSDDYSLTVTHPFMRSRAQNFTGRVAFDARNTDYNSMDNPLYNDRVRAVRVGGTYDTSDPLNGVDLVDVSASQGFGWPDATDNGPGRSRTDGQQGFTKWNVDASRIQTLPYGFSVLTAASAQYSPDALLISEQYALGGVGFGQAYDNAEITGDSAIAGKVELRFGQPVGESWLDSYQLYGYYDIGAVYNNNAFATFGRQSLASAGTGVRINFTPNLYGYLELGFPLTRNVASEGDTDPRIFFSLTARY